MHFVIVSRTDHPLYEAELAPPAKKEDAAHLHQLILLAALDAVDERVWDTTSMYLKVVDKFNDLFVSCYTTAGNARLLLLHDSRSGEEAVRAFFQEVHELYLKALLNPFFSLTAPLQSPRFDQLVRSAGKRHLMCSAWALQYSRAPQNSPRMWIHVRAGGSGLDLRSTGVSVQRDGTCSSCPAALRGNTAQPRPGRSPTMASSLHQGVALAPNETKVYDVTDKCSWLFNCFWLGPFALACYAPTRLTLAPVEAVVDTQNICGHNVRRVQYGDMGDVSAGAECGCPGFSGGTLGSFKPGCCGDPVMVAEIVATVKARYMAQGDVAILARQQSANESVMRVEAKLDALLAHFNVPQPVLTMQPAQQTMKRG